MNTIDTQLTKIRDEKRMGLMTHVVVGYPSLDKTMSLVKAMEEGGADFVELQIPFSDPLADGPTIMKACEKALESGVKVQDAFKVAEKLSSTVGIPLLFMAYFNTVFHYGIEKFCHDAKKVGISGLIVPDVPLEEEEGKLFVEACKKYNLCNIRVLSPSSTLDRMKKNAKVATGFIYCTARQGITDAKKQLDPKIANYLQEIRKNFSIPIAVGFGISSKERVDLIRKYADIAVVGSALIDIINESLKSNIEKDVVEFLKRLKV